MLDGPRRFGESVGPGTRIALALCLLGFAMQAVVSRAPMFVVYATPDGAAHALPDPLALLFAIHGRGLAHGFFWTPVTYMFLHGSWVHLLLNAVGLLMMGSAVEALLGTRRFWTVFLLSGIVGGIGWALLQGLGSGAPCVGASAGVLGFVGAYAALRPREQFMLILPFPVTLSARALAVWLVIANALDLAFGHGQVAYLAHLAGIVTGVLYGLALRGGFGSGRRPWRWNPMQRLRREPRTLDDVLAHVSRNGIQSLSAADRSILEAAARRGIDGNSGGR